MADNNKIIIEIVTSDKGTTAAIKNNKKLDDSMKKTRKSTDDAANAGRGYHATHKSIYQTNLSSAKGFSKQAESIGSGGSSGLVGAYATLAANVFAATAAFNALRGAAQVQTLIEGFTFLGNAAGQTSLQIANGLKEITNNAISLEESLRASAIALTSGFDTNQIAGLAEVARNASIALGRNMGDSIDRLFRGVAKLEPEILDELGIMVRLDTAVSKYAATLGKNAQELTDYERRQAFLNETLTQGALKYGDLSNAVDPNVYDKLSGSLQDLANTGLELINKFLNPFIQMLASNSGALMGGLILFGSTILTTMIPALGQMAERQAAVANTARMQAQEQAKAGKQAAQLAKIEFVRGSGSAALTTKGKDFSSVSSLKKALKSGKVEAADFDKALKQVQNTKNRTASIADANGKAQSAAHLKRIAELEALEMQILDVQRAEAGRSGSAGTSALAGANATGQENLSGQLGLIGGAGVKEGFTLAKEGFKDFRKTQQEGLKDFQKGLGKQGLFKKWGGSVMRGFTLGSAGARLFGAALLNAIPIVGQVLFFGGMLISFLSSFKGEATAAEKAQAKLSETVDTAKDKVKQLAETNKELVETLKDLDESYRATVIEATKQKNTIIVTAGVVKEARINFENYTEAMNEEKVSKFGLGLRSLGETIVNLGSRLKDFLIERLKEAFPLLTMIINKLADLGIIEKTKEIIAGVGDGIEEVFGKNTIDRQAMFDNAIANSNAEIDKLRGTSELFETALKGFDPSEMYKKLQNEINPATKELFTFEEATNKVNEAFRAQTKDVEDTAENIKSLGTGYQEMAKVVNKNLDSILKKNAFDKIGKTVQSLNNSLIQLSESSLLSDAQIMDQITLATKQVGVEMGQFGVTVESVRTNIENGLPPYKEFQDSMESIATLTRENSANQKELAQDLRHTAAEFAAGNKDLNEFDLKMQNLKKTGKFELGVVANFELQLDTAKRAKQFAEDEAKIKKDQVDAEYALELLKLQVFAKMTNDPALTAEMGLLEEKIKGIIKQRKAQIDLEKGTKIDKADSDTQTTLATAGQVGTLGERSTTAAAALGNKEIDAAAKLEAIQGATQPMLDALNELGPEGAAVSAAFSGIMSIADAFAMAGAEGLTTADKLEAVGSVVSAISAAMAANSKAQIKEIDTQIEAEKKRDGKSKESLAKIAAMEKKKDQLARKAFEQGKKMKIAQAIISTSAAIAGQLSADPVGPWNVALAAMMGALGMAQVKIIQKQQYQGGDSSGGSATPQTIQVGKRTNRVDTSRAVTDGELAFLRGAKGQGSNANNFTPGGAAGMKRGYANGGEIMVGERGPETIKPMAGGYQVTPNDKMGGQNLNANITINAIDSAGVEEVLTQQRGNIIGMIREAAHEHGEEFIEAVNTSTYGAAEGDGGY